VATTGDREVCILIFSAWLEESETSGLRARAVHHLGGDGASDLPVLAAAGIDETCLRLREWLERFAAGDAVVTQPVTPA
jgi:hypothetical protein